MSYLGTHVIIRYGDFYIIKTPFSLRIRGKLDSKLEFAKNLQYTINLDNLYLLREPYII